MKKNRISELALFGEKPSFSEILHVGRPNLGNKQNLFERLEQIYERNWLTNNGPFVRQFEEKIAGLLKVKHCIAVCNGTIALEIAVRALGMKGEVIIPSFTFVATAHCLQWQEIKPVFCDISKGSCNISPEKIEELITSETSGIMAVNLWGQPCFIEELEKISEKHGLKLLFDSSHAFACTYKGKYIGNFGDAEVFSFHATKFLNTFEGGAIVTESDELAEKIRLMRNFGFSGMDNVIYLGTNGKMTEISAAMGLTCLEDMDSFIETNIRNYKAYSSELDGVPGIKLLQYNSSEKSNYQYIIIEIDSQETSFSRDTLMKVLHAENVLARRYFYPGCHRMEPYKSLYPQSGSCLTETENLAGKALCLPTGTGISEEQIKTICEIIRLCCDNGQEINHRMSEAEK